MFGSLKQLELDLVLFEGFLARKSGILDNFKYK